MQWKAVIPHTIVILWLVYLGAAIWQHNVQSVQPPLYDPLSYMEKALNFWKAVDQKKLLNPLNLEPTVRPPGTILMSYPFGFSPDFRGFHFRSVFFPILCIVLAVYLAAGIPGTSVAGWGVAAVAILFSSIPMFYSFDCNEIRPTPYFWGLVDNFQAGFAAMATAGFIKSLKTRSLVWLMWGAFCGSFTLLIKPSGLMIMALLAATWLIVVIVEWFWARKHQQSHSDLHRYVIIGGIQILLIYSAVVLLCFFSNYFSIQNFAYAKQALKIMEDVLKVSPFKILSLLFDSAGIAFILWVLGVGIIIIHYCFNRNGRHTPLSARMVGLLLSIPVIWSLGAWYWLVVQAGGNQVRYFYPFFLMGAVCLIPVSLHVLQNCRRWIRLAELVLCFLPALNIGALLALESPSIPWQRLTGVNISVAEDREEVSQAYAFLDDLRKGDISPHLYSFHLDTLSNIFITVGKYEKIIRPDLPVFIPVHPIDWVNGFSVKVEQLITSDYILIRKNLARSAINLLSSRQIDTFIAECTVFQAWLYGLDENSGLKTVSDGRELRLLEIVDKKAFGYALESFVAEHSWRSEFVAANSGKYWWNAESVSDYTKNPEAKEIDFEGIYALHALSLGHTDAGLKVEVWWEELRHKDANSQRYMFFHLVDQSGKMLRNLSLSLDKYDPPFDSRRWRYGSVTFEQPLPDKATSLAFGIFHPNNDFLMPHKGIRDWEGKRVLVSIPTPPSDVYREKRKER